MAAFHHIQFDDLIMYISKYIHHTYMYCYGDVQQFDSELLFIHRGGWIQSSDLHVVWRSPQKIGSVKSGLPAW